MDRWINTCSKTLSIKKVICYSGPVLNLYPYLDTISQGRSPKAQSRFPSPITIQCCKQWCIGTDIWLLGRFLQTKLDLHEFWPFWAMGWVEKITSPSHGLTMYNWYFHVDFMWTPRPSSSPGAAQHPPNRLYLLLHCRLLNRPSSQHLSWSCWEPGWKIFGWFTFTKAPRISR